MATETIADFGPGISFSVSDLFQEIAKKPIDIDDDDKSIEDDDSDKFDFDDDDDEGGDDSESDDGVDMDDSNW